MSQHYDICDAHGRALQGIREDAAIGRLPFYDYAIEYFAYFELKAPEPSGELLDFLQGCEKIGDTKHTQRSIESIYKEYALEIPIGLMDLPVWWARAIIASVREVNWVEPDTERTQAVFEWTMVHLQGAYLDIQFANPIPDQSDNWHLIGGQLIDLHRRFEQGPFTQPGRLIEFI